MTVERIAVDCDRDTLLFFVRPMGPACHTGQQTCFFEKLELPSAPDAPPTSWTTAATFNLDSLFRIIEDRKLNPLAGSYTSSLFALGEDEILKKLGEEAVEVILAAKSQGPVRLQEEIADWIYHMLVLVSLKDMTLDQILLELSARHQPTG